MKRFLLTLFLAVLVFAGLSYAGSAYVVHSTQDDILGALTKDGWQDAASGSTTSAETSAAEDASGQGNPRSANSTASSSEGTEKEPAPSDGDSEAQSEAASSPLQERDFDCILVLGCGLEADGSPSPMLEDRLETALFLYRQGAADVILLSGDNGEEDYNEVAAMLSRMQEAGVPSSALFCDYAGFSTYDSLYRAQAIFQAESVLVVTQTYHLYRALYIGNALGLDVSGVGADRETYSGQFLRELREIASRDKDLVKCLLKPEPTLLGDPIDIHGESNV